VSEAAAIVPGGSPTEPWAFAVVLASLLAAPALARLLATRGGRPGVALAIGAGFLGIGAGALTALRPDLVAPLLGESDIALLYPSIVGAPALALLVALAAKTEERNRRAVHLLALVVGGYFAFDAHFLLRDPARMLGPGGHWKDDCWIQSTGWSCAPSAATSLLRAVRVESSEGEMARLMRAKPGRGSTLLLMRGALDRKLAAKGLRAELAALDYDALVAAKAPALVSIHLELIMDHAVALISSDEEGVTILDPLRGRRRLTREEFLAEWKRHAILVRRRA
jgi:hypothetical protein